MLVVWGLGRWRNVVSGLAGQQPDLMGGLKATDRTSFKREKKKEKKPNWRPRNAAKVDVLIRHSQQTEIQDRTHGLSHATCLMTSD